MSFEVPADAYVRFMGRYSTPLAGQFAALAGEPTGARVLDVGCGPGMLTEVLVAEHGEDRVAAIDPAAAFVEATRARFPRADVRRGPAEALPWDDDSFGASLAQLVVSFMSDPVAGLREMARVTRPGGRLAFSVTHPTRWMFPDDPTEAGLLASQSYWDRTPYVEVDDETGETSYVEHHRTVGDWVRALAAAGYRLVDLVEPEWPEDHERVWGGWSAVRGRLTPGTAIFAAQLRP